MHSRQGAPVLLIIPALVCCGLAVVRLSASSPTELEQSHGDGKVYAAAQTFEEGAVFGDHNHFGRDTRFGPGTRFGDDNTFEDGCTFPAAPRFGSGNRFGKQVTIGAMATIGPKARFEAGAVIGQGSAFGPEAVIGDQSFIAGGQIFEGGDKFGQQITFGPFTRFGPNTLFSGAELFSRGCTFGDHTKFNYAGAGIDKFVGGHSFGQDISWGGNPSLPSHPQESQDHITAHPTEVRHIAHAAPSHGKDGFDLPPGYSATSIPGVYQYTAPEATKEARCTARHDMSSSERIVPSCTKCSPNPALRRAKPHKNDWDWTWQKPVAGHLAPVGLSSNAKSDSNMLKGSKETDRLGKRGRVVQKAMRQIGDDLTVVTKRLSSWLKKHPSVASAGPTTTIMTHSGKTAAVKRTVGGTRQIKIPARSSSSKMDGFEDRKVKVTGTPQDPKTKDDGISFFNMF